MSKVFHQELIDCRDCPLHQSLPGGRFCSHPARLGWIIGAEEIPHFPQNCPLPSPQPAPSAFRPYPVRELIEPKRMEVGP